ncbi:hypothetical protein OG936_12420 [Streptomyces sp. NBC_00846]|uniref:hypothetical protein n=1 Tax=Streptomyces sp. NBC_00846 TaxID=2975849 RepID=UPI0038640410|nr:hypothetical protein OG936_12420 [Streptomyces sp. NBC_00846]
MSYRTVITELESLSKLLALPAHYRRRVDQPFGKAYELRRSVSEPWRMVVNRKAKPEVRASTCEQVRIRRLADS